MFNDPRLPHQQRARLETLEPATNTAHTLNAQPTVLMDSRCCDCQQMAAEQRRQSIRHWIGEGVRAVRGQVAVMWHPHTMSQDYGWSQGFESYCYFRGETCMSPFTIRHFVPYSFVRDSGETASAGG